MKDGTGSNDRTRGGNGKFIRDIDTVKRDAYAAQLRSRGWTYQQIGDELGTDKGTAFEAVKRAMAEVIAEPAADALQFELERLDLAHREAMAVLEREHVLVSNGKVVTVDDVPLRDDGPVLAAIDRLVRISESRRKLLGLDQPTKTQVSGGLTYEVVGVDPSQLT